MCLRHSLRLRPLSEFALQYQVRPPLLAMREYLELRSIGEELLPLTYVFRGVSDSLGNRLRMVVAWDVEPIGGYIFRMLRM